MPIFSKQIDFKVKAAESQFIHWFRTSVADSNNLGNQFAATNQLLMGSCENKAFWFQKKENYSMGNFFEMWFSVVTGEYEPIEDAISINLTVQVKKGLRNLLIFGIVIWWPLSIYFYLEHQNDWLIYLPIVFTAQLFVVIWRVREDANLLRQLLTEQIEKYGL
ncbi:hypothetical protein [Reichenbachiella sp. MSK19-1]|uniref:hypothetical protein n=1 Tax=Reichenbachiella sp. MSK19-1 TaxID=1897631 RepID=UPI000E6C039B|nr:hypothetical protein [Reichenbachiella sp. MSK19-1]RJE73084.1 hypothetical protein BGP76_03850 [Reichenbachiella sp. MSK19-1]